MELISFHLTILKPFEKRNEHIDSTNAILKSRPLSTFQLSHIISCTKHGTPYLVLNFLLAIFIHLGVDLKYLWPTSSKNERKQNHNTEQTVPLKNDQLGAILSIPSFNISSVADHYQPSMTRVLSQLKKTHLCRKKLLFTIQ